MNRDLNPTQALQWLARMIEHPVWSKCNRSLTGTLHGRPLKGRDFATGLCIAIKLSWPVRQINQACLLLAATPEAGDDAIYMEQGDLWLMRRYPATLTEVELELLLKQQLAMVALLVPPDRLAPTPCPFLGRLA
ncbi:protein EsaB [Salmonella enterica subsp. enterica]|nr:protein EsaB [Salmonella enterica subsp. enterica serovar Sandiego]EEC0251397.1 protein EsaB [Salmonella enterica subsp. enterica]EEE4266591.1 protein EsaB [Salmonella enterica subsp. enterica serovar Sandiego]